MDRSSRTGTVASCGTPTATAQFPGGEGPGSVFYQCAKCGRVTTYEEAVALEKKQDSDWSSSWRGCQVPPFLNRRRAAALLLIPTIASAWFLLPPTGGILLPPSVSPTQSTPLDCRVVALGPNNQEYLNVPWQFLQHRLNQWNNLIGRASPTVTYLAIELENTSPTDILLYPDAPGRLFHFSLRYTDSTGALFHSTTFLSSLKRLGHPSLVGKPPVILSPGAIFRLPIDIYSLTFHSDIKPGRYTVHAVCSLIQSPGDVFTMVESSPFHITITPSDLRAWRRLH